MLKQIESINEIIYRALDKKMIRSANDITIVIKDSGCIWLYIKTIRNHTSKLTIFPDSGICCGLYGG